MIILTNLVLYSSLYGISVPVFGFLYEFQGNTLCGGNFRYSIRPAIRSSSPRPSICDVISATKQYVSFSRNSVIRMLTRICSTKTTSVKIIQATVTLKMRAYMYFYPNFPFPRKIFRNSVSSTLRNDVAYL